MPYHDELLTQAGELIHKDAARSTQADYRRAVSTAYYALFHLLVSEKTLKFQIQCQQLTTIDTHSNLGS